MKRFYHHLLKAGMLGIAVMLVLVMFCGYSEETAQSPAAELAEVGSFEEEQPKEELLPADESGEEVEKAEAVSDTDEMPEEETQLFLEDAPPAAKDEVQPIESAPEQTATPTPTPAPTPTPTPAPTPMPMFDIIDGRTIYLSITEEEFIEISGILREGLGVHDAALAGIMGNLQGESGFDPHKVGDDGGAFGICQWRGARLDQMVEYCEEHDLNPVSRDGQLSFLIHDLMNNYIYAYDQIRLCEDSERGALQATYNFCAYYEVPANPEEESLEREEWTKLLIYPKLNELSKAD